MKHFPKLCVIIGLHLAIILTCVVSADELDVKLVELLSRVNGAQTPLEQMKEDYLSLTKQYGSPEQMGRIYGALADMYCQSGLREPEAVLKYAELALDCPMEPLLKMRTYLRMGQAMESRSRSLGKAFEPEARRQTAVPYLKGLHVAAEQNLPDVLPEMPHRVAIHGAPGPLTDKLIQENERKRKLQEDIKITKQFMDARDLLELEVVMMYLEPPGSDEQLRMLAREEVDNDASVDRLMKKLQAARDESEGRPIEGPSVLYPNMPAEMRARMKGGSSK